MKQASVATSRKFGTLRLRGRIWWLRYRIALRLEIGQRNAQGEIMPNPLTQKPLQSKQEQAGARS